MKKILFSTMIACLLAFVGCQNEELVNDNNTPNGGEKVILTANIQGAADSRVVLTPDTDNESKPIVKVKWNESGEKFKVYGYNSSRSDYYGTPTWFTQIEDTNQFEGTLPSTDNGTYLAVYGDDEVSKNTPLQYFLAEQDGTLTDCLSIPIGNETFYLHYVLMRDTIADLSSPIEFEHETAILKPTFKVGGTDIDNTITQIVMGNVIYPTTTNAGITEITIIPHLVEQIQSASGTTFTLDDDIYIHLPMAYIPDGQYSPNHKFTFTVTAGGKEYTGSLTIPTGMSIVAGKLYTATIALTEVIPYVTFRAASTQTLDLEQTESQMLDEGGYPVFKDDEETIPVLVPNPYPGSDGDTGYIEYSVGNSNVWTKFTPEFDPVAFGGDKGDLHLRGISPYGTLKAQIVFGNNTTPVACSGDIRTLVDWENYATAVTSSAIFRGLFENCTVLTSAPELPATNLADQCYWSMFWGCTSLAVAPKLPATTLANGCYVNMFHGCTKLTEAPELKAAMLVEDCYNGMFAGCTSLTAAPELLATTLAGSCCISMFNGCTSLRSAPALLATTLVTECYYDMFRGCTSLNSVTMLATDISAENCLTDWMSGVPAGGTFTNAASMTSLPTGASGIPSGWIVKNYGESGN